MQSEFKNIQNTATKIPEPFLRETRPNKIEEPNHRTAANLQVGRGGKACYLTDYQTETRIPKAHRNYACTKNKFMQTYKPKFMSPKTPKKTTKFKQHASHLVFKGALPAVGDAQIPKPRTKPKKLPEHEPKSIGLCDNVLYKSSSGLHSGFVSSYLSSQSYTFLISQIGRFGGMIRTATIRTPTETAITFILC